MAWRLRLLLLAGTGLLGALGRAAEARAAALDSPHAADRAPAPAAPDTVQAPPASDAGQPASRTESAPPLPAAADAGAPAAADSIAIPRARLRVNGVQVAVLRAGPGPQHALVATVHADDILVVDARCGEWYHATAPDGASGWVHSSLLANDVDKSRFTFVPDPGRRERQGTLHLLGYLGSYAADREDNGFLYGGRLAYALTPRWFFEVGAGRTRVVRSTYIIEQIYNLRLEEETFKVFFYEAGGSFNLLPLRRVTPYLSAAVGATILNSRVEPTWCLGLGTRAFLSRRWATRWEVRDHRLHVGNQFTRFTGDNLEFSAGMEVLF